MKRLLTALVMLSVCSAAHAEVLVGTKHLVIIKPGLDALWGNYIFAVRNDGETDAMISAPLMLPKETVDYQPQDGVEAEDIRLREDGIAIEKSFPPGMHIISIAFRTDVRLGTGTLTMVPGGEVSDFTLLLPQGDDLSLTSGPLTQSPESPDPAYRAWRGSRTFAKGDAFVLKIGGVPEGRLRYWVIGGAVGGLLLLLAGFFAYRSRPKLEHSGVEALVITD